MENNPSVRFYCSDKETLDKLLDDIDKLRKTQNATSLLTVTLQLYLAFRVNVKCEGCKKGMNCCKHWSPEKVEVNWS